MGLMRNGVNPLVSHILMSRFNGLFGGSTTIIRFHGRRSQRSYSTPVNYVRDGSSVYILPGHSEEKLWWRNLIGGADVELVIRGEVAPGRATVLTAEEGAPYETAVASYFERFPRARKAVPEGAPIVRVTIGPAASEAA
jgi:deazaflavin-dependent oxidoreductase (nitroreductase family)